MARAPVAIADPADPAAAVTVVDRIAVDLIAVAIAAALT